MKSLEDRFKEREDHRLVRETNSLEQANREPTLAHELSSSIQSFSAKRGYSIEITSEGNSVTMTKRSGARMKITISSSDKGPLSGSTPLTSTRENLRRKRH